MHLQTAGAKRASLQLYAFQQPFEMLTFSSEASQPSAKIGLKPLGQGGIKDTVRDYYYHYVRYPPGQNMQGWK